MFAVHIAARWSRSGSLAADNCASARTRGPTAGAVGPQRSQKLGASVWLNAQCSRKYTARSYTAQPTEKGLERRYMILAVVHHDRLRGSLRREESGLGGSEFQGRQIKW